MAICSSALSGSLPPRRTINGLSSRIVGLFFGDREPEPRKASFARRLAAIRFLTQQKKDDPANAALYDAAIEKIVEELEDE